MIALKQLAFSLALLLAAACAQAQASPEGSGTYCHFRSVIVSTAFDEAMKALQQGRQNAARAHAVDFWKFYDAKCRDLPKLATEMRERGLGESKTTVSDVNVLLNSGIIYPAPAGLCASPPCYLVPNPGSPGGRGGGGGRGMGRGNVALPDR